MKGKRVIRRRMKAFVLTVFFFLLSVWNVILAEAEETSDEITASELYARSAVLMDADSEDHDLYSCSGKRLYV